MSDVGCLSAIAAVKSTALMVYNAADSINMADIVTYGLV